MVYEVDHTITYDYFWKHISITNETFGLLKANKDDIYFVPEDETYLFIKYFLKRGINQNPDPANFSDVAREKWQYDVETYCKHVWLTNEYMRDHKFRNFQGIHWNPEFNKYEIHPGGARQIVYYYFGPQEETFIGFNTGGIDATWVKKYNNPNEFLNDFPTVNLVFCRDYNTLIPHALIDIDTINPNVIRTHAKLKQFFKTTNITANFDLQEAGYVPVHNAEKQMVVTLDKIDTHHMIKAFLLMPNYDNFSGYGITIETT